MSDNLTKPDPETSFFPSLRPKHKSSSTGRSHSSSRGNQALACECLSALEGLTCGAVSYLLLRNGGGTVVLAGVSACLIALTTILLARVSGPASFDGFESRRALLPSALAAAILMAIAIMLLGGRAEFGIFCIGAAFCLVFLTKLPSIAILRTLIARGYLNRMVAIACDNVVIRNQMAALLLERTDIQIVGMARPSDITTFRDWGRSGCLDEIVVFETPSTCDQECMIAAGATVVKLNSLERKMKFGTMPVSRWNTDVTILAVPPLRGWNLATKRFIDVSGALTALLLLSPVLLIAAIAVRLETPGPIFFRQQRCGQYGRPFEILKFRSMYAEQSDSNGSQLTSRNDPRVTRIGNLLRRTSIDELPQLFNVLNGTMSLIGPRPHPSGAKAGAKHYDDLIPAFYKRYVMLPGISGLAQVSGLRGNTLTEDHLLSRYAKDMEYAANWSPLKDICLVFATAKHLMFNQNNAF